jgi:citrate synthase
MPSASHSSNVSSTTRRVNDIEYLSSDEVMQVLGIRKATLYTYVSRGLVRTIKQPGQKKANLYLKADVDRLRTRVQDSEAGPVISRSLRYGEPVVQSWICEITPAGPRYRGQPALALVKARRSFEYVAELIWGGLPRLGDGPWALPAATAIERLPDRAREAGPSVTGMLARIALDLTSLERASGETAYLDGRTAGIRLIQLFATSASCLGPSVTPMRTDTPAYVAQTVLQGLGGPSDQSCIELVNAALVLSADHELSAPTFVARICASTGVDLYACVIAALMAHSGPMQVGGATDLEALLLREKDLSSVLINDIPCFGHPLYVLDPRAELLLAMLARCPAVDSSGRTLIESIEAHREKSGRYPNLFGALVIMELALNLPPGSAVLIHTVGRTAGWIAHAVEQRHAGAMLRPRAKYVGTAGQN